MKNNTLGLESVFFLKFSFKVFCVASYDAIEFLDIDFLDGFVVKWES